MIRSTGGVTVRRTSPALWSIATALVLAACDDAGRPLAPSEPRASLSTESAEATMLAFVHTDWYCGQPYPNGGASTAGCSGDTPLGGAWGWSSWSRIATINADGSAQADVTGGGIDGEPAWSPDGMQLAFNHGGDILVVGGSGGTPLNLTNLPGSNYGPAWSPDGTTIVFGSSRDGLPEELFRMNATDGSGVTRVTHDAGFAGRPDWSPDGTRIAFDCVVESGNNDICTISADGTGLVRLTTEPGLDLGADWSPNGDQIAFFTDRYGSGWEIAIMQGDGSGTRRVAPGMTGTGDLDWSPDGGRIAFAAWNDGCYYDCVYVIQADGTNPVLVTASGGSPAWRPSNTPLPPPPPPPPPPPDEAPVAAFSYSCTGLACKFNSSGSTDDEGIYSRSWTFGDGASNGNAYDPIHTYTAGGTYAVTLVVADGAGQTDTATQNLTVADMPPVAGFTVVSCTGLLCAFDSDASSDDRGITSRSWAFGDGSTANSVAPFHTYLSAGTYVVTLTVTDGAGQSASTSQSVTAVDRPPVARFTYACSRTVCTLDGRSSTDDVSIVSHSWRLGNRTDGSASSAVVTIDYRKAGSYPVTLTVTDNAGQTGTVTQTVVVTKGI